MSIVRSAVKPFPGPIPPTQTPDGLVDAATYRLPDGTYPERDRMNPVERMAMHRVYTEIAGLSASEVVQIAIWPMRIAELAKLRGRGSAILYNTLSLKNHRRYEPVRALLVDYLRQVAIARGYAELGAIIDRAALAHLIEAKPGAERSPQPLPAPGRRDEALELPATPPWRPTPGRRTGGSPIERLALEILREHLPALPASIVVQHAFGPVPLAEWAKRQNSTEGALYNMLRFQNQFAYPALRRALAEYLGVSVFALDWLIEARRPAEPIKVGLHRAPPVQPTRAPALAVQATFDLR